ncbi:MAG: hypothetical protein WA432_03595 [Candidatus Babeliaceae bacterium]
MKHTSPNHHQILTNLSALPRKILSAYDAKNLSQLVLHDLCDEHCFNIPKAIYLVDNPDFNCLNGIAGFQKEKKYPDNAWENPEKFSQFIQAHPLHQKVRSFSSASLSSDNQQKELDSIAQAFDLSNPHFYIFGMKNDNQGIVLFEQPKQPLDDLLHSFSLLGFCPLHS